MRHTLPAAGALLLATTSPALACSGAMPTSMVNTLLAVVFVGGALLTLAALPVVLAALVACEEACTTEIES